MWRRPWRNLVCSHTLTSSDGRPLTVLYPLHLQCTYVLLDPAEVRSARKGRILVTLDADIKAPPQRGRISIALERGWSLYRDGH